MFDHTGYEAVREDTLNALDAFGRDHLPGGDFIMAVLCGDLTEATGHADHDNQAALTEIARYVYNELPGDCHGSSERVEKWLLAKQVVLAAPRSGKPRIYAFCNGGSPGWYSMQALTEDGMFIAGHVCSHPNFGPGDMGVTGNWKHDTYRKYYPDGFEVVWVEDVKNDPELKAAYAKHLALSEDEYKAKTACLKEETAAVS